MAMAIWPDARVRKSTSPGENGASVVRKIDRNPSARPRFASGILQKVFMPSAASMSDVSGVSSLRSRMSTTTGFKVSSSFLNGRTWRNEQLFLDDPLSMRKIHGKYPEFLRSCIGQRNIYRISAYDLAYVGCDGAQDLPQVEARRDSRRQIEEQL